MSTPYTHFTTSEREMLLVFRSKGMGIRKMAEALNRSPSSVSRELRRNRNDDGSYSPSQAEKNYLQRRQHCVRKRLLEDPNLFAHVKSRLLEFWSPEQISGRLVAKKSHLKISFPTIYRAIHSGLLDIPKNCLRRKGRKPSPHKDETRGRLHGHKTIHDRPLSAEKRSRFGHWEGDTVLGARAKGVAATFVDRKSGFLVASRMPDRKAATMNLHWHNAFAKFPASLKRSFTVDHGNEFFSYAAIEDQLHTKVFFADPYSPWQRGSNENTNGLLRQYFPKKFDFLSISDQEFQNAIDSLNNRPRKRLGFRTPAECFPTHLIND